MEPIQNTHKIVQSAQRGDRDAFARLAEIHRGQVEALARLRMSPELQRKVGVDDVVQETFAQALESLGAAGPVNIAAAALMLHDQHILPPLGADGSSDRAAGLNANGRDVTTGVAFACGMGGVMAACLIEREPQE